MLATNYPSIISMSCSLLQKYSSYFDSSSRRKANVTSNFFLTDTEIFFSPFVLKFILTHSLPTLLRKRGLENVVPLKWGLFFYLFFFTWETCSDSYLHELKQESRFDGNRQIILGGVFTRNRRQEGVPNGAGSFHSLLQTRAPPHRAAFDPPASE